MSKINRIPIPTFDMTWVQISPEHRFIVLPGGGGSAKSGVKNQLLIAKYNLAGEYEFLDGFMTDLPSRSLLCSGVATGIIQTHVVICALIDRYCAILQVEN